MPKYRVLIQLNKEIVIEANDVDQAKSKCYDLTLEQIESMYDVYHEVINYIEEDEGED